MTVDLCIRINLLKKRQIINSEKEHRIVLFFCLGKTDLYNYFMQKLPAEEARDSFKCLCVVNNKKAEF